MSTAIKIFIVMICILSGISPIALAKQTEWKENAYDFTKVKTILIMDTEFMYDGFDISGKNQFHNYPNGEIKIENMLMSRWEKVTGFHYVTLPYIIEKIKADPNTPVDAVIGPDMSEDLIKEIPKYADLVLFTEIHDFGWFYEYYDSYYSTETVIDRVRYGGVTADGKAYSGWMEVPRSVVVHHDAGYLIYDSADLRFRIVDSRTWKDVWKYSDRRDRTSSAFGKEYDPSGPESVMKRILNVAFDKLPFKK